MPDNNVENQEKRVYAIAPELRQRVSEFIKQRDQLDKQLADIIAAYKLGANIPPDYVFYGDTAQFEPKRPE